MTENELASIVVDLCVKIHRGLGPGLLESAYESVLAHELERAGLAVERQKSIPLYWDGCVVDDCYRADIIVGEKLLLELKSVEKIAPVHIKQVITYLKLSGLRLGLLLNFGAPYMKNGICRLANGLDGS